MKKKLFAACFILVVSLFGRENPFVPAKGSFTPSYTANYVKKFPPFTEANATLSPSVRVLQSITFTCKNLDGSITNKTVQLNKAIDWHKQIYITQTKPQKCTKKQVVKKPKNQKKKKSAFKKVASLKFASFYTSYDTMKIQTNDKLLRNFKLIKPDRIILDFKRDADFRTYSFKGNAIFKKITIGNHSGYYRVVLELDGHYIYSVVKKPHNYLVKLH